MNVEKYNTGTVKLMGRVADTRDDDRFERARKNSKTPEAIAKMSATLKGRMHSPATIEAVRKADQRPRSKQWCAKMAAYWRKRGHPPGHPESRFWTPEEDAQLGTAKDAVIATRIGRSVGAVAERRINLGIPFFRLTRQ